MKKSYLITVKVLAARGHQVFELKAESAEEAVKLFNDGGGEFVTEEVSVTDIGEPMAELNE